MDISYELEFDHKKNLVCMAKELREIDKKIEVLKIAIIIFLRNDCENMSFTACMGFTLS